MADLTPRTDMAHAKAKNADHDFQEAKAGWDFARQLEREAAAGVAWIPVAEQLPPKDAVVVALWAEQALGFATMQTCYHDGVQWLTWHYGSYECRLLEPAYWMPLPPAPVSVPA